MADWALLEVEVNAARQEAVLVVADHASGLRSLVVHVDVVQRVVEGCLVRLPVCRAQVGEVVGVVVLGSPRCQDLVASTAWACRDLGRILVERTVHRGAPRVGEGGQTRDGDGVESDCVCTSGRLDGVVEVAGAQCGVVLDRSICANGTG